MTSVTWSICAQSRNGDEVQLNIVMSFHCVLLYRSSSIYLLRWWSTTQRNLCFLWVLVDFHRIIEFIAIEWLGLEANLKDHLVPNPLTTNEVATIKSGIRSCCLGPHPTWLWTPPRILQGEALPFANLLWTRKGWAYAPEQQSAHSLGGKCCCC